MKKILLLALLFTANFTARAEASLSGNLLEINTPTERALLLNIPQKKYIIFSRGYTLISTDMIADHSDIRANLRLEINGQKGLAQISWSDDLKKRSTNFPMSIIEIPISIIKTENAERIRFSPEAQVRFPQIRKLNKYTTIIEGGNDGSNYQAQVINLFDISSGVNTFSKTTRKNDRFMRRIKSSYKRHIYCDDGDILTEKSRKLAIDNLEKNLDKLYPDRRKEIAVFHDGDWKKGQFEIVVKKLKNMGFTKIEKVFN